MASSALRGSLLRRVPLHRSPTAAAASATGSVSRRSFQAGYIENADEFEKRLFGNNGNGNEGSLYSNLDRVENASRRHGYGRGGFGGFGDRSNSGAMGGFDSLNDGMNQALGDAARNFQADDDEEEDWDDEEFEFRPDVQYRRGSTYKPRDLDVTRPAAARNPPRPQFETTTKEVLRKADFRNVRFLSNFLTEAGIMIKRSQTRISAKAQRKVAREIKTARAFGLMPFTTMGRRPFIFGRTAEEHHSEEEFGYDFVDQKDGEPAVDVEDAEPAVEPV